MNNAIEVNNVSKKFRVYFDKGSSIKEKVLFHDRNKYEERVVLDDISFQIGVGEAVGLVGKNGCGKSTLLKLLNRIIYPNDGSIQVNGRISSLIELGAGFHPDMTGRENIYINASIFGLKRKEIDRRLDSIIEFSELEQYIDNPVRTYSSGMYMRLAFSVAINVDADVLLIDEILAVGDANFQAKCFNKLRDIKAAGTTIVIVSHSLGQIEQICDRSIWIKDGKIERDGAPKEVHLEYLDYMGENRRQNTNTSTNANTNTKKKEEPSATKESKRWGNGKARIDKISLINKDNEESNVIRTGDPCKFLIDYSVFEEVEDAVFGIGIFRNDGIQIYGTNTRIEKFNEYNLTCDGSVALSIDELNLLPGEYLIDFAIESQVGIPVDYFTKAVKLTVYSEIGDVGITRQRHRWDLGGTR